MRGNKYTGQQLWQGLTLGGMWRSAACASVTAAARTAAHSTSSSTSNKRIPKEVREYWEGVLECVDKATAKKLTQFLDLTQPLGLRVPEGAPGATAAGSKPRTRVPLFAFYQKEKQQHPYSVLLVRVGEFYESVGTDAVLLVQHAGLNPMGSGDPPRAGCPRQNLRRTVMDLVEAGLSVAVYEESPEAYSYGSTRTKQKQRYLAQVVSPASPHLVHGLVDEEGDVVLEAAPPLLGIFSQAGGYGVVEVNTDLQTLCVTEGLTEDAVYARLHEGGLVPPLFLHVPRDAGSESRLTEGTTEREWEVRCYDIFRTQVGVIHRYDDPDPVEGMLMRVRRLANLDPSEAFNRVHSLPGSRPRPLYHSTACNLGLHKTRGVPSLLDATLPSGVPLASRRWMRNLLLLPPPPAVGLALNKACGLLAAATEAVPEWPALAPTNVVLKLRAREANDTFFRELAELCRAVEGACREPDGSHLAALTQALLAPTEHQTGLRGITRAKLANGCREAAAAIHAVVDHDESIGSGRQPGDSEGENASLEAVFARYTRMNEDWRSRVRNERLGGAHEEVVNARRRLQDELKTLLSAVAEARRQAAEQESSGLKYRTPLSSVSSPANMPSVFLDVNNNALWLRIPKGSGLTEKETSDALGLIHPRDRNGKVEPAYYSSAPLESALDDYRRACSDAAAAVREQLQLLADRLKVHLPVLVSSCTLAVVASALDAHVREAQRRGWELPNLAYGPDAAVVTSGAAPAASSSTGSGGDSGQLLIKNMWPYWLDRASAVHNSYEPTEGMFLLTGPNMAGKSTVLRSTAAVALLAACGLLVPAEKAKVPYLDAFMLRNFSSDSPLEGRSSFAVEMTEMRYVLQDVTPHTLVLVDELGKGTEARAGAALAGAMLEALDASRCKGIFATHLHQLLAMPLGAPRLQRWRMETAQSDGRLKPTWRMVPGASTDSLALVVAADCKLPLSVVARAEQLYHQLQPTGMRPDASDAAVQAALPAAVCSAAQQPDGHELAADFQQQRQQSPPLTAAAEVLVAKAREVLADLQQAQELEASSRSTEFNAPSSSSDSSKCSSMPPLQAMLVRPGFLPPPSADGAACVYVLRSGGGWYYCGSSDGLRKRLQQHRGRSGKGGPQMEACYIVVEQGQGGTSAAKAVETATIQALADAGFPMRSTTDARRTQTPRGAGGTVGS